MNILARHWYVTEHLPAAETAVPRQEILVTLGELLVNTSQYEEAQTHLQEAYDLALSQETLDEQLQVCRWMARLYEVRGEYPDAYHWIERGLAIHPDKPTADHAQILLIAGLINIRQGDYNTAVTQCKYILEIAGKLGEVTVLARAYNLLGITHLRGDSSQAIAYFEQAFDAYQRAGDIYGQATAHNLIANAHFNLGRWDQADYHYRQARQMFDQIGDIYHWALADNNLGGIALNRGQLDEALTFYHEALASLEKISASVHVLGLVNMNLGATNIRGRDLDLAQTYLQTSQQLFEDAQSRGFLPELYRHQARTALYAGEMDEAAAAGQKGLNLALELEMRAEEGSALCVLGEIAIEQAQFSEAVTLLNESVTILEEVAEEYQLALSRFSLARAYTGLGQRESAFAELDRCQVVFSQLAAAIDLAAVRELRQQLSIE